MGSRAGDIHFVYVKESAAIIRASLGVVPGGCSWKAHGKTYYCPAYRECKRGDFDTSPLLPCEVSDADAHIGEKAGQDFWLNTLHEPIRHFTPLDELLSFPVPVSKTKRRRKGKK